MMCLYIKHIFQHNRYQIPVCGLYRGKIIQVIFSVIGKYGPSGISVCHDSGNFIYCRALISFFIFKDCKKIAGSLVSSCCCRPEQNISIPADQIRVSPILQKAYRERIIQTVSCDFPDQSTGHAILKCYPLNKCNDFCTAVFTDIWCKDLTILTYFIRDVLEFIPAVPWISGMVQDKSLCIFTGIKHAHNCINTVCVGRIHGFQRFLLHGNYRLLRVNFFRNHFSGSVCTFHNRIHRAVPKIILDTFHIIQPVEHHYAHNQYSNSYDLCISFFL